MKRSLRQALQGLLCGVVISSSGAESTDPVGYATFKLVAGKKGAMALPMAAPYRLISTVTAAGSDYVEIADPMPPDLIGPARSACLDVRTGPAAGQSLNVTGAAGARVTFDGDVAFPISVGDRVGFRPYWSLGEILDPTDLQKGGTHDLPTTPPPPLEWVVQPLPAGNRGLARLRIEIVQDEP